MSIHLVKVGKGQDVVRYAAPFSTSTDAYFGVARTRSELVDMLATMGLDPDEEAEILTRGEVILEGVDPPAAETIDMVAFSALYERLYGAVGFAGWPAPGSASQQMILLTVEEVRLLVTGIRFLREFYDEGDAGIGVTGLGFVTL